MSYYSPYFNYLGYVFVPYLTIWFSQLPMPSFVRAITTTGDYSYGLYVYGWPVQQCIVLAMGNEIGLWPMIALSIVCTLPFAIASYHWVEAPALTLKA
jgi:peptidoglycan/LPS O-acetylase OafA/YrhL